VLKLPTAAVLYWNSLSWNDFLTVIHCTLVRIAVECTVYLFWYFKCCTANSDGDCQLIPPVHKANFPSFSLFFTLSLNRVLLCPNLVYYHPWTVCSRETGIVFQALWFSQTVSPVLRNFSNMFVFELVVLSSVNCSLTLLEGLLLYSYPRGALH
jgi:hypothetical protein